MSIILREDTYHPTLQMRNPSHRENWQSTRPHSQETVEPETKPRTVWCPHVTIVRWELPSRGSTVLRIPAANEGDKCHMSCTNDKVQSNMPLHRSKISTLINNVSNYQFYLVNQMNKGKNWTETKDHNSSLVTSVNFDWLLLRLACHIPLDDKGQN